MPCYDVDDETSYLLFQLQLQDLEDGKQSSKGKNKQDEIYDADFAVETFKSELKSCVLEVMEREKRHCNSCLNTHAFTDVARCPCNHQYCRECLQKLFQTSLTDESLFPLRCWGRPIPINDNLQFLTEKLFGEFHAKTVELSTPNRIYCHEPTCSTLIPKEFIKADIAFCQRCKHNTCVMCKGAEHKDQVCAQDTLTQDLLQIDAANGWQRCFSCRRLVELEHGCNHMTCRCGAEFCYLCGNRWKTCACAHSIEERLYARANVNDNRNAKASFMNSQGRVRRIEREAQILAIDDQRTHDIPRRRSGTSHCRECHDSMPLYINECPRCHIRASRRRQFSQLRATRVVFR
ncbi:ibr finger domain-containing protein [Colletotrichum incanum]|uniref:RBR-type E3 ubiquitin transferase n=1 Tax=Colletotrichum incanum TaxID=1573173 RepID=A0A167CN79_COLIC|nr:ibr finger domain-containing protein [Colletotrichum incanum]OHW95375.1 ibr finger domain-containing protein [Colletotrichum incanum]